MGMNDRSNAFRPLEQTPTRRKRHSLQELQTESIAVVLRARVDPPGVIVMNGCNLQLQNSHSVTSNDALPRPNTQTSVSIGLSNPLDADDDLILMQRIAGRDARAMELLFDRHAGRLLNLCWRVTGRHDLAEDAVLEAFWETWDRPERFDARRATPLTYLLMLARCRALDRLRAESAIHARQQQASEHGNPSVTQRVSGDSDDGGHREPNENSDGEQVDEALQQVSLKCREALQLCVVNGLTAQQAARSLGIPLGTMKSRVRKGIIQMRALLRTP